MPVGTSRSDVIAGTVFDEIYLGFTGDYRLIGSIGLDTLDGSSGNDITDYSNIGTVVTLGALGALKKVNLGIDNLISIETVIGSSLLGDTVDHSGAVTGGGFTVTGTTTDLAAGFATVNGSPTPLPLTIFIQNFENIIGSIYNDTITGNSSSNIIDGGAGADMVAGGLGNDTYVGDNTGDVVTEAAGAGTDTVQSSITYALGATLENPTLTGAAAAINGTGNGLNNIIKGNGANNILTGGLSSGNIAGGLSVDTFTYNTLADSAFGALNRDMITDFLLGVNKLDLSAIDANLSITGNQAFTFIGLIGGVIGNPAFTLWANWATK